MDLAPVAILEAAMHTLHRGLVYVRNLTLQHDSAAAQQANDLTEAMHEGPQTLTYWSEHNVNDLRLHFGCYHHARWEGGPDFIRMFDEKLAELCG